MSKEYIDKDEFYDVIDGGFDLNFDELPEIKAALLEMIRNFQNLDPTDVKPVVLCKDCKHYNDGWCYNPNTYDDEKTRGNTVPDWYCADGERREENK